MRAQVRDLAIGAMLAIAVVVLSLPSFAASVTLSNGASCTASSVVVTCTGAPPPIEQPNPPVVPPGAYFDFDLGEGGGGYFPPDGRVFEAGQLVTFAFTVKPGGNPNIDVFPGTGGWLAPRQIIDYFPYVSDAETRSLPNGNNADGRGTEHPAGVAGPVTRLGAGSTPCGSRPGRAGTCSTGNDPAGLVGLRRRRVEAQAYRLHSIARRHRDRALVQLAAPRGELVGVAAVRLAGGESVAGRLFAFLDVDAAEGRGEGDRLAVEIAALEGGGDRGVYEEFHGSILSPAGLRA
jgi:hypothetical protein